MKPTQSRIAKSRKSSQSNLSSNSQRVILPHLLRKEKNIEKEKEVKLFKGKKRSPLSQQGKF